MKNRYLEKVAAKNDSALEDGVVGVAKVGVGAGIASHAPQRLLGYHVMYHGTSKANAASIKKNGFNIGAAGTGAAQAVPAFKGRTDGRSYFTKNRILARHYAGIHSTENYRMGDPSSFFRAVKNSHKGEILKVRIPDGIFDKMKVDRDHVEHGSGLSKDMEKDVASTINKSLGAKTANGANPTSLNRLRKYYTSKRGLLRAGRGAGLALAGAALVTSGVKDLNNSRNKYLEKAADLASYTSFLNNPRKYEKRMAEKTNSENAKLSANYDRNAALSGLAGLAAGGVAGNLVGKRIGKDAALAVIKDVNSRRRFNGMAVQQAIHANPRHFASMDRSKLQGMASKLRKRYARNAATPIIFGATMIGGNIGGIAANHTYANKVKSKVDNRYLNKAAALELSESHKQAIPIFARQMAIDVPLTFAGGILAGKLGGKLASKLSPGRIANLLQDHSSLVGGTVVGSGAAYASLHHDIKKARNE